MRLTKEHGLLIGRLFESEAQRQLHIAGYRVSRTCDQLGYNGIKAPMLYGPFTEAYRLPDLDVMGNGDSFWIEAKYKAAVTKHGLSGGQEQHGIDWPNWIDYLKICEISGRRGFLLLGQGSTGEIIMASFKHLAAITRHHESSDTFPRGMAFWPRAAFTDFGTFSPQTGQMQFAFKALRPAANVVDLFRKDAAI